MAAETPTNFSAGEHDMGSSEPGTDPPLLLSARPSKLPLAAQAAPGIELKLDWEDAADLGANRTLTDICVEQGVDPSKVVSVHLPPGTTDRNGMAVAPGTVGTIIDFTHTAFGEGIDPEWLTLHSVREFDYRAQVQQLRTITETTGHALALENPPDRGLLYAPEGMAFLGFLAGHADPLENVSVLVDTAHVSADRDGGEIDDEAVEAVFEHLDPTLQEGVTDSFRDHLRRERTRPEADLDPSDPWRPALATLGLVGGDRVRAVHLNDPETDGVPDLQNGPSEGLRAVVEFCQNHGVALVLEPDEGQRDETEAMIEWLTE